MSSEGRYVYTQAGLPRRVRGAHLAKPLVLTGLLSPKDDEPAWPTSDPDEVNAFANRLISSIRTRI